MFDIDNHSYSIMCRTNLLHLVNYNGTNNAFEFVQGWIKEFSSTN